MTRILLAGWLFGVVTFGAGAFAGANWYEYRILDTGDDLIALVNRDGWELIGREGTSTVWKLRRPRLRLH